MVVPKMATTRVIIAPFQTMCGHTVANRTEPQWIWTVKTTAT